MPDFWSVLQRVQEHQYAVERIEHLIERAPEDRVLRIGLGSARRRAEESKAQLLEMARPAEIDLINYRLDNKDGNYSVSCIGESILSFQKSLTALVDWSISGAKKRARYSDKVLEMSALRLAYTYPGSRGIVLAVENKRDLLDGKYDKPFFALLDYLQIENTEQALDASRHLGLAAVSALHGWISANAIWKNDVDLIWRQSTGIQRGEKVTTEKFNKIHEIFEASKEEEIIEHTVEGELVGLDVEDGTFHIRIGIADLTGKLAECFDKSVSWLVPSKCAAQVQVVSTTQLSTGKINTQNFLQHLFKLNH